MAAIVNDEDARRLHAEDTNSPGMGRGIERPYSHASVCLAVQAGRAAMTGIHPDHAWLAVRPLRGENPRVDDEFTVADGAVFGADWLSG